MYVNGNPIDVSYSYNVDASNSAGGQRYNITMSNSSELRAKIYENQFMFEDADTNAEGSNSMSFTRPYSNYTKYYYPYYNGEEPTTW